MTALGPAIGIDLGTTNSCVGVFRHGKVEIIANEQGNRVTPSYVAFSKKGGRLVGDAALNQAGLNPTNTVFDAKRLIGRRFEDDTVQRDMKHWPFEVVLDDGRPKIQVEYRGERKLLFPEEISSMVLVKMKETAEAYLGCKISDAVITVPAYFNDSQRHATKDAATIAGLNVLRIINEPTAAALAYGLDERSNSDRNVLVYDLGGGTFDVSILTFRGSEVKALAVAGDTHLGGEDFDNRMVDHFIREFSIEHQKDLSSSKKALRRLRTACERAKRTLSSSKEASVEIEALFERIDFDATITRARFDHLCDDLFRSTLVHIEKALQDANLAKHSIDDIVLVGGSTRIPRIQQLVRNFFNGKELKKSIHQDEAVAYGAAVQAAILSRGSGDTSEILQELVLLDITPLSLGIKTTRGRMSSLVKRNTPIPVTHTRTYYTANGYSAAAMIEVYEGEHDMVEYNNFLGEFKLVHPPVPKGSPVFEISFDIDADGILTVSAVETVAGNRRSITITSHKGRLSKDEIERMVDEAKQFKSAEGKHMARIEAKNKLEDYALDLKRMVEDSTCLSLTQDSRMALLAEISRTLEWLDANKVAGLSELYDKRTVLQQVATSHLGSGESMMSNETLCGFVAEKRDSITDVID